MALTWGGTGFGRSDSPFWRTTVLGGGLVGALVAFLVFALYWLGVAVLVFDVDWLNPSNWF